MGLQAQATNGERTQMQLPKKGPRPAVLTGLIDIGVQTREYQGEMKKPCREFIPLYTLPTDTFETDEGETRNCTVRPFPIKLMPGATRGKYFDMIQAFDPDGDVFTGGTHDLIKLLGKKVFANISHSEPDKDGLVYANMSAVSEIPVDYPVPEVEEDFFIFDLDSPDRELFASLNSWVQGQIRNSEGYAGSPTEAALEGEGPSQGDVPEEGDDAPY